MGISNLMNNFNNKILSLAMLILIGNFSLIKSQEFFTEKYRPQFHFSPKEMWMNDPNGLVYNEGKYHLFFQYYPKSTVWGPMHWGHATSKDMVHWEQQDIALYPDEKGYIFSGSAVVDKNNTAGFGKNALVAIFTYHEAEKEKLGDTDYQYQGLAYSIDNGKSWKKYEDNPVLPNYKKIRDFRDPKVFWDERSKKWQMVLAAGNELQFFESFNLKEWKYQSSFKDIRPRKIGVWECPDLFEMRAENGVKKWVLLISHGNDTRNGGSGTRYFIGDWNGKTFTSQQEEDLWLDYGFDNYAGVTFNNTKERILIGWMSNWQYATTTPTVKWRSSMTVPRELRLENTKEGYRLHSSPIKNIKKIIGKTLYKNKNLKLSRPLVYKNNEIRTSEINLVIDGTKNFEIKIGNDKEQYEISFNPKDKQLRFNREKSGRVDFNENFKNMSQNIVSISQEEKIRLRILLDESSVETFVNEGEYVVTDQIFPMETYSKIEISGSSESTIKKVKIKSINKIW